VCRSIRKRQSIHVDYDRQERNYIVRVILAGSIGVYNSGSDRNGDSFQHWLAVVLHAVRIVVDEDRADDF